MFNLLNTPVVQDWMSDAIRRHSKGIFGKLEPALIWSDAKDDNGKLLVSVDPIALAAEINRDPYILLHNHDPGKPKGQVRSARSITLCSCSSGTISCET